MNRNTLIENPVWDAGKVCVVCGSPYVEKHHIFCGSYRKAADRRGYIIPLCREHHTGNNGIHFNKEMSDEWRRTAEMHYLINVGSRRQFYEEFGRNYL